MRLVDRTKLGPRLTLRITVAQVDSSSNTTRPPSEFEGSGEQEAKGKGLFGFWWGVKSPKTIVTEDEQLRPI